MRFLRFVRRMTVQFLALYGAWVVTGQALNAFMRWRYPGANGSVVRSDGSPIRGVGVFLDRGSGSLERYETDSLGRFHLPISELERRHAQWLMCAPGMSPIIGNERELQLGSTRYGSGTFVADFPQSIRSSGWRGPYPRECPGTPDETTWRLPRWMHRSRSAVSLVEPQWKEGEVPVVVRSARMRGDSGR